MFSQLFVTLVFIAAIQYVAGDYNAAVVEYNPVESNSPYQTVAANLEEYKKKIQKSKDQNAQIIVFPEYGLTGLVTDPEPYAIEMNDNAVLINETLISLSNAAKEYQIYVLVNLLEKAKDKDNKTIYYNTNLLLDLNGKVGAKYRKMNLYEEPNLTPGTNGNVTYKANIGGSTVVFGIFTCFDILFYEPSRTVLYAGATDILYPTAWSSINPFFVSLSVQSAYSTANGVNLLAAGLNSPKLGLSGTGIYSGEGDIVKKYISGKSSTDLLTGVLKSRSVRYDSCTKQSNIFNVQGTGIDDKNKTPNEIENLNITKILDVSKYTFLDLDLTKTEFSEKVCSGSFCCNFELTVDHVDNKASYKLVVLKQRNDKLGDIRACALLACSSDADSSCGDRIQTNTTFKKIVVSGAFPTDERDYFQPTTLKGNMEPITDLSYCDVAYPKNNTNKVTLALVEAQKNVHTFGIFCKNSGATIGSSLAVLLIALIALFQ